MPDRRPAGIDAALADWPVVHAFARQLASDAAAAEDLAQEAFLRLIARGDAVDTSRPLRSFLLTTVRRIWIDRTRRTDALPLDPEADFPSDDASPLDHAEFGDDAARLRAALATLPRTWAAALFLADGLDAPAAEIAEVLGTTPEVVRVTLHRARRRLRERLRPPSVSHPERSRDDR